jgi:2-oxoglutarate ferredoxin oxidoreductase subunit alpha
VVRAGPGLGTIQPSQCDYFQTVKGGGHGDYKLITLAPNSVQEMYDFVDLGFKLAFKYRNPAMILTDGLIGQVMEKVELTEYQTRRTDDEVRKECPWATMGKTANRPHNIVTSLELESDKQEIVNHRIQAKYRQLEETEVRFEEIMVDDAEFLFVAYGSSARICQKALDMARAEGIKVGILRPITLYPFPTKRLFELSKQVKGMLSVEMSAGQMVEDIRLATKFQTKVEHFGRLGGMIHSPAEVLNALKKQIIGG